MLVEIRAGDHKYLMFLPNSSIDYIQKKLATDKAPYEYEMLLDMGRRLAAGDLVLDVGANIGNHSLYLAAAIGCRVLAFEPNQQLSKALASSISANGLDDRIAVHSLGVGEGPGSADFVEALPENLGGQKLHIGQGGIPIVALDSLTFEAPVKAIKIDVEGMELAVLKGAKTLLNRDRPILYIECLTEEDFCLISNLLEKFGYGCWDTFNASPTHLFVPKEKTAKDLCFERLRLNTAHHSYAKRHEMTALKSQLDAACLKYRNLSGLSATQKEQLGHQQEQLVREREQLADARLHSQALANEMTALKSQLDAACLKYRNLSEVAAKQKDQLAQQRDQLANENLRSEVLENDLLELRTNLSRAERSHEHSEQQREKLVAKLAEQRQTLQLTKSRLASSEGRLAKLRSSFRFQLGCALHAGFTSLRGFKRLPFALWTLFRHRQKVSPAQD